MENEDILSEYLYEKIIVKNIEKSLDKIEKLASKLRYGLVTTDELIKAGYDRDFVMEVYRLSRVNTGDKIRNTVKARLLEYILGVFNSL
jgi:hypothetical protein